MTMFLDQDEIIELTNRKRRDAQKIMLNSLGITYKVRADGSIAILRAHVEKEFGGNTPEKKMKKELWEPNWD
jgi:hypothetical protein